MSISHTKHCKTPGKLRPELSKPSQITNTQKTTEPNLSSNNSSNSTTTLTEEQEQQFQLELYWCIQQLQAALSKNKLSNKQIQEHTKALNGLMNNNTPMIKKRQIMRLSFGDYRKKMLEEEKKAKKVTIQIRSSTPNDKSLFIRKALVNSTGGNFKFNFPSPSQDNPENHSSEENVMENESTVIKGPSVFSKSDNSFRFNFSNTIGDTGDS